MYEHVSLHGPGAGVLAPLEVLPDHRVIPVVGAPQGLMEGKPDVDRGRVCFGAVEGIRFSGGVAVTTIEQQISQ